MKAKDIRRGSVIMYNNAPYRVMDFHHHTPGNLRAMVQTKLRNLLSGNQTEVRFSSTEDIPEADVYITQATFLYNDNNGYHFMTTESYEELSFDTETIGDARYYLQEGMQVEVSVYNQQPISVTLPKTAVVTIADTEPELRGATASNSPKPAKTESGLALTVPPFIKIGDKVIVDTEEGKYVSRAEQ
jgi:elongation factor P